MSNKTFQKNIVNPYAPSVAPDGYDLFNDRNKWVLAGIHDCSLNFGFFPPVGYSLTVLEDSPLNQNNSRITSTDLQAYLAIYPQNGTFDTQTGKINILTENQQRLVLTQLVEQLTSANVVTLYTSVSSPGAQDPEVQRPLEAGQESDEDKLNRRLASLIAIPYNLSSAKLNGIRTSFNNPLVAPTENRLETVDDQTKNPIVLNPDDIDLEDWRNSVPAGSFSSKVYYNSMDGIYYFTRRTTQKSPQYYDISDINGQSANNINLAIRLGVESILKFSGKYSQSSYDATISDPNDEIQFVPFLDERPNSNWIYAVKIPKEILDQFTADSNSFSTQEGSLSPLEKAQIVINREKNNTTKHFTYTPEFLSANLPFLVDTLNHYEAILRLQQLADGKLSGLMLRKEIDRIKSFTSNITDYSNISTANINNNTIVDFCLSDSFNINYLVVDGNLFTQNLGKNPFIQMTESESENIIKLAVANVFSSQTSTSLSYIFYLKDILKQVKNKQKKDWTTWSVFIPKYTYPKITISPDILKDEEERNKFNFGFSTNKKDPKFFETFAEALRSAPTPSGNSDFASFYENFVENGKRDLYNSFRKASANCDSDLSNLLKDIDLVFKVLGGKTNSKVLINRAISQLKQELIKQNFDLFQKDSAFREELGLRGDPESLEQYIRRPNIVLNKIETYIENKLRCLFPFDDIAATLQKQLRQNSVPPQLSSLIMTSVNPPLTYRVRKIPTTSNPYEKWFDQLEKLFVKFIKQLVLGVITQMLEALLGCGPDGDQASTQQLAERLRLYGFVNLNEYLDGVDILSIASKTGLQNEKIVFRKEEGDVASFSVVVKTKARVEQLRQMHNDISAILTPGEIKSLLDGEASGNILNLIKEMIYGGNVNTAQLQAQYPQVQGGIPDAPSTDGLLNILSRPFSSLGQKEIKIIMNEFQDSLQPGDERYASLNLTEDKITAYFLELGRKIRKTEYDAMTVDPPQSPLEAFCPVPPPIDELSDEQIKLQLATQIQATEEKIKSLCETRDDLFSFDINAWFDGLGLPNYLKQILDLLARLGKFLNELLASLYSSDALAMEAPRPGLDKRCEQFGSTMLAQSINRTLIDTATVNSTFVTGGAERASNLQFVSPQQEALPLVFPGNPNPKNDQELFQRDTLTRLANLRSGNTQSPDVDSLYSIRWQGVENGAPAVGVYNPNEADRRPSNDPIRLSVDRGESSNPDVTEIQKIFSFFERLGKPPYEAVIRYYLLTLGRIRQQEEDRREASLGLAPIPNLDNTAEFGEDVPDAYIRLYRLHDMINLFQHLQEMSLEGVTAQEVADELNETGTLRYLSAATIIANIDASGVSIGTGFPGVYRIEKTLAQASFQNFIEDDSPPETDRTIYENFRSEPYPNQGSSVPGPPVTLLGVRESNGNPSQEILDTINEGIRSRTQNDPNFVPETFDGSATDFIPSLVKRDVQDELQAYLMSRDGFRFVYSDVVSNSAENVYEQLCKAFFTQPDPDPSNKNADSPYSLAKYMSIVNSIPFNETGDKCNADLARLMMKSLQIRMTQFFINIVPLQRAYGGFNNPTTLNLVSDYLYKKFEKSFIDSKINAVFQENIDEIFKLYDKDLSEGPLVYEQVSRNTFKGQVDIGENRRQMSLDLETYEFKLRYIIKKYLVAVFYQIPQGAEFRITTAFPSNFYNADSEPGNIRQYSTLAFYVYGLANFIRLLKQTVTTTVEQDRFIDYLYERYRQRDIPNLQPGDRRFELTDKELEGFVMLGSYYFPMPPLLALYMITYDVSIDISSKFYLFKNNEVTQKKNDEAIISFVNPNYIPENRFEIPKIKI